MHTSNGISISFCRFVLEWVLCNCGKGRKSIVFLQVIPYDEGLYQTDWSFYMVCRVSRCEVCNRLPNWESPGFRENNGDARSLKCGFFFSGS